jgi:L-rhamnose mutarotase
MTDKTKSAELILKLYELRREEVMRQARNWFFTFNPESAEDVAAVARGEHSAYYRMVTSYWDMACSFVNHGAIDEQMFLDANGEQNFVFAKVQPFIAEIRQMSNNPSYLAHMEKLIMRQPEAEQRLAHLREMARKLFEARAGSGAAGA